MTRYTREEYGQPESDEKMESMSVIFTIQWMTGKVDEITYDPRLGWYHLKRKIMKMNNECDSPAKVNLLEKKGGDFVYCNMSESCSIQQGDHYYVVIGEPIIHEKLEYMYSTVSDYMEYDFIESWRFVHKVNTQYREMCLIIFYSEKNGFCSDNDYYLAKHKKEKIPWIPTVEAYLEKEKDTHRLEEQEHMNMIYLWNTRYKSRDYTIFTE